MANRKYKKELSQSFLVDKNYLRKIADSIQIKPGEKIFEIGTGRGQLTQFLVEKGCPVASVEIDEALYSFINEKFKGFKNFHLLQSDIRKAKVKEPQTVLVGNIPYHLSFEIMEFLVNNRHKINRAFLTFQKEFVEKLTASLGNKDYSFLTCFSGLYAEKEILFNIPKNCFSPRPKVDSSFVRFNIFQEGRFHLKSSSPRFIKFLRRVFSLRRKKIRTILKKSYPDVEDIDSLLNSCGVCPDLRPEKIPLSGFVKIFNQFTY